MTFHLAAAIVTACLFSVCADVLAQTQAPDLTRQQRDLLQALVTAVDRTSSAPAGADHAWLTHVLRASDGSHYIAFALTPPAETLPKSPVIVYVRLATAQARGTTAVSERSLVREWLLGSRGDPRLLPRKGGFALGDMPAMGAVIERRDGTSSVGSADLQAIGLQRERSRERREEETKRRRAALEGAGGPPSGGLPFEDFDIVAPAAFADGTPAIQRALTAGPGAYDLMIAWADASQPAATARVQVARRSLQLAPAVGTEFGLSSVIVADHIGTRITPYSPLEQRSHPYSIGATEIVPARDTVFTPSDRFAVAFQIVNPMPSASGKPEVVINLRIARTGGAREEVVAALSPLVYDATTLPPDFDLRLGHPLIAALAAPLATIPRGEYRLVITAEDRLSSSVVSGGVEFTVRGTPATLLAEAPPLGRPFRRDLLLTAGVLDALVTALTPASPSPALAAALKSARDGRFADLLVAATVPSAEQGVRTALTGLALFSLGNPSSMPEFQRALLQQAPAAPAQFLLGASRAMLGRDGEAIAAWNAALQAGFPPAFIQPRRAEAYLRQKDFQRAAAAIDSLRSDDDPPVIRTFAATRIATRREADAIVALDGLLATHPADLDAQWLLVHALFSDVVNGNQVRRERFLVEAKRHIDANGANSALAAEWLAQVK